MNALERLGSYVAASGRERRCEAVRELVELHLIDTVGALIASARTVEGLGLLRFRAAMRARGQGAWPLDLATRCALARLSEIDDIHLPSMTTPGAIVIPGALTFAGALPAVAADDMIAAILAGTEAMTRLGRAIDGPAILYRGIWPTYFAAPFGMAAAAARLLRLDEEATAHALALALTLAAPAVGHHNAATTSRWFAVGNAARNGLNAALAAQQGFTSDRKLLEGRVLPDVLGITPAVAALTDGLGERTALTEVSFKPWCAARQTMAATQALKDVIASGVAPAAIDAIAASVPPPHLKMIDHGVRRSRLAPHQRGIRHGGGRARARAGVRRAAGAAGPAASRSRLDGEDQGRGGRALARRLSDVLAGAPARCRRLDAARARRDPRSRRSRAPLRSRARAGKISVLYATGARRGNSRPHARALHQRARNW